MKTTSGAAAAIEVRGLRMTYGTKEVLSDVGFTVAPGEVIALLGPNGAGKTTTIEILEGFRAPSGGHVRVLGAEPVRGDERWRARLGVVLQSWRDHGRRPVCRLLGHLARYYEPYAAPGRPPFGAAELIDVVGLTEHADQRVSRLSGGQRRRLDVAIGIVGRPEVLFLDEPTAGFDPQARRDFHDLAHRLSDLDDTTILLTTHDLDAGMVGYLVGRVVALSLTTVCSMLTIVVAGILLLPALAGVGPGGWLAVAGLTVLGLLFSLPLGAIVGAMASNPQTAAGLALITTGGLVAVSGVFYPITALAGWLQTVAQIFPIYWLGLGMRAAMLPDAAAVAEIGGSWRPVETVLVLAAWAAAALVAAPPILRRMARRESGSMMEARRRRAMQRIG